MRCILEQKKDFSHLDLNMLITIMETDMKHSKDHNNSLSLLNREFGREMVALMDKKEMTMRELSII